MFAAPTTTPSSAPLLEQSSLGSLPAYAPAVVAYAQQTAPQQGAVLMVYGCDVERANCDALFNLFCQYGNVLRVKFMKTKRDTCMIEMSTQDEMQVAIACFNGATLFGRELALA